MQKLRVNDQFSMMFPMVKSDPWNVTVELLKFGTSALIVAILACIWCCANNIRFDLILIHFVVIATEILPWQSKTFWWRCISSYYLNDSAIFCTPGYISRTNYKFNVNSISRPSNSGINATKKRKKKLFEITFCFEILQCASYISYQRESASHKCPFPVQILTPLCHLWLNQVTYTEIWKE